MVLDGYYRKRRERLTAYRTPRRTAPRTGVLGGISCLALLISLRQVIHGAPTLLETLPNGHISLRRTDWFRAELRSSTKAPMSVASDLLPDFQRSPRRRLTVTLEPNLVPIACSGSRTTRTDWTQVRTMAQQAMAQQTRGPHPFFPHELTPKIEKSSFGGVRLSMTFPSFLQVFYSFTPHTQPVHFRRTDDRSLPITLISLSPAADRTLNLPRGCVLEHPLSSPIIRPERAAEPDRAQQRETQRVPTQPDRSTEYCIRSPHMIWSATPLPGIPLPTDMSLAAASDALSGLSLAQGRICPSSTAQDEREPRSHTFCRSSPPPPGECQVTAGVSLPLPPPGPSEGSLLLWGRRRREARRACLASRPSAEERVESRHPLTWHTPDRVRDYPICMCVRGLHVSTHQPDLLQPRPSLAQANLHIDPCVALPPSRMLCGLRATGHVSSIFDRLS